ncbi:branched-chain alpha-keto acid dehydrogenase subunit E2 [Marinosulfonomonas sp. PRT-SC04]|nr:branched-chain alpha-keto acid dehydrogenase subunit E2 [Marinosulfonomonas sp. PRT-SC04]
MWRHITSNFLVVLLAVISGVILLGQSKYKEAGPLEQAICLRVESGSNMRAVSVDLAERGAVSSGTIFRIGAEYSEKTQLLKAGSFLVPEAASMVEIVDIVTRGGKNTCGTEIVYRVGIRRSQIQVRELDPETNKYVEKLVFNPAEDEVPAAYTEVRSEADVRFQIALAEGVTSWQIVEALKAADFLEGDVTEMPAEGMLAPDSYEVKAGADRATLLQKMQDAQVERLEAAWATRAEGLPLKSMEEALVLASIVEKETGLAAERRQVASVFINRLNQGIRLQTDPTVIYGITKGQSILGRGLRRSELRAKTDYNTYQINGLPPGPIANPGKAAIEAALNPDTTEFIFFVADGTGGHAFAKTLREHNDNVAKWRVIEAQRSNN